MLSLIPKSSVGGASIGVIGALNHSEGIALAGLCITLLTFLTNVFFQIQKDRRDAALNAAQIRAINKE